ncbi:MAG: hypothetical protein WAU91_10880 [Desulfatitalea sp.]
MTTASEYSRGMGLGGQYDAAHVWFIANTVRNCNVGALEYRNAGGFSALFNTVYNADMFVAIPHGAGGSLTVSNNIFSTRNTAHNDRAALAVGPAFTHDYNLFSKAADDPGAEAHRRIEAPAAPSQLSVN